MKIQRTLIPTLGMMLALSSSLMGQGLKAGDWDFSIKPRLGYTMGDIKDNLNAQNMLGLGLQGSYGLGNGASIDGELVFEYYNGKGYKNMTEGAIAYTPGSGATTISIKDDLDVTTTHDLTLNSNNSADFRKNSLQGFSLRGGYSKEINSTYSWRVGLTLNAFQFRQEASGQLMGSYFDNFSTAKIRINEDGKQQVWKGTPTWEGLSYTPTTTKLNVGAYVGVKARLNENAFFECNLVSMGYQNINYVPFTYTGKPATTTTSTKRGIALEVAFGLKL